MDKDGDQDLVVVGDWMPIKIFENDGKGNLDLMNNKLTGPMANRTSIDGQLNNMTGLWQGLTVADFDKDGDMDVMVGNLGPNTKFRKMGDESALKMYVKDFDKNNAVEQIVTVKRGEAFYPVATKDELGKQLPSIINKRFTNYPDFAGKNIEELMTGEELSGSDIKEVNTFESVYLENKGDNSFEISALPFMAQVSKVFSIHTEDFDNDGNLDVAMGGNFYTISTYQGRYDASDGLILKGNGKGQFSSSLTTSNGFLLKGEVRGIKAINTQNGKLYLVSRTGQKLQIFQKKKSAAITQ
jgi:hypothetical protein